MLGTLIWIGSSHVPGSCLHHRHMTQAYIIECMSFSDRNFSEVTTSPVVDQPCPMSVYSGLFLPGCLACLFGQFTNKNFSIFQDPILPELIVPSGTWTKAQFFVRIHTKSIYGRTGSVHVTASSSLLFRYHSTLITAPTAKLLHVLASQQSFVKQVVG